MRKSEASFGGTSCNGCINQLARPNARLIFNGPQPPPRVAPKTSRKNFQPKRFLQEPHLAPGISAIEYNHQRHLELSTAIHTSQPYCPRLPPPSPPPVPPLSVCSAKRTFVATDGEKTHAWKVTLMYLESLRALRGTAGEVFAR